MNPLQKTLDTIYLLNQKKTYEQFTTKDIQDSIISAVDMLQTTMGIKIKNTPTYLNMSRDEMIECSITLWKSLGEAFADSLVNKR
jgi:hypothetical protein